MLTDGKNWGTKNLLPKTPQLSSKMKVQSQGLLALRPAPYTTFTWLCGAQDSALSSYLFQSAHLRAKYDHKDQGPPCRGHSLLCAFMHLPHSVCSPVAQVGKAALHAFMPAAEIWGCDDLPARDHPANKWQARISNPGLFTPNWVSHFTSHWLLIMEGITSWGLTVWPTLR